MSATAWTTARLRHHAELNPRASTVGMALDQEVDFMPMESLAENGTIDIRERRPLADVVSSYSGFNNGDVIYAKVTPCFENGKAAPVQGLSTGVAFGTTEVTVLRPRKTLHQRFLYYLISEDRFRGGAIAAMTGAGGLRRVPDSYAKDFSFSMPPLAEQQRIAEFLDRETAQIDELIAKQEQLISTLAERRSVFINDAVTGSLSTAYVRFESGVSWLGSLPANWTVRRFRHLATDTIGLTYSPDDLVDEGEGTLVLRAGNVKDGRLIHSDDAFVNMPIRKQLVCKLGDIVVCARSGSKALVGKCGIVTPEFVGSSFGAFMTVVRSPMNDYLYWVLNSGVFLNQLGAFETSTINQLTSAMLRSFPIAVPPEDERAAIVSALNETTAQIDTTIERTVAAIGLLRERRQALISAAVTGKINVGGAS